MLIEALERSIPEATVKRGAEKGSSRLKTKLSASILQCPAPWLSNWLLRSAGTVETARARRGARGDGGLGTALALYLTS
jgi:hypothetical protein